MPAVKRKRNGKERWWVDFRFQHPDGRTERVQRMSPVNTRRGAEEYERQLRPEMLNPRKEVPTLERFAKVFLETYSKANHAEGTQDNAKSALRRYLLPRFGDLELDKITTDGIERLKKDISELPRAPKTVNNVVLVLSKVLHEAMERDLIDKLPRFKLLKTADDEAEFLDFEEYGQLISAQTETDILVALLLGGDAGLRRGEINALQWTHINFKLRKISVQRSMSKGKTKPTKGYKKRKVPLTDELESALKAHRHLGRYVLMDGAGPWTAETFRWRGPRAYRLAGLPVPKDGAGRERPWHTLRHSFCSHLAIKGCPSRVLQKLAGHENLTTSEGYMHLTEGDTDKAIALLNDRGGDYMVTATAGGVDRK